jgi:hypothetical protein
MGCGRPEIIAPHLRSMPLVTKPYDLAMIRDALGTLRRQSARTSSGLEPRVSAAA